MSPGAFESVRVLDASDTLAGAYAARLLGDAGADVLLVEPPQGHALRAMPPFLDGREGVERSLLHAYVNANKRSLVREADDTATLAHLVSESDLVVTTAAPLPARLERALAHRRHDAIHLSVTPYGLTGSFADAAGNNLTHSAASGWAEICGYEGEPPLQLPPNQTDYVAGVFAFVGAAAALVRRARSGQGAVIDVSELDAMIVTAAPWALAALYDGPDGYTAGVHAHRRDRAEFYRAADGELSIVLGQGPFWVDAMHALGLDELADERYTDPVLRRAHLDELRPRVEAGVARFGRRELFERLSTVRCATGIVQDTADLLEDPQLAARNFFVSTSIGGHTVRVPGAVAKLSATPLQPAHSPAPDLNNAAASAPFSEATHGTSTAPNAPVPAERPLAGVRVLTFTQGWAGPLGTELLALLGADVVQIEARRRPDVWRTYVAGYNTPVPPRLLDPTRRQRGWNCMGLFNAANLNKRAITLDLSDPRGADIFWQLVPRFDVVAESFSPHVLPNWGITYESLQRARSDIIFASLSGYGTTGPYASYSANGATIEPMSGLASIHGYAGGPSQNTGGLLPDPVGGMYLAAAVLIALHHRARTGEGQRIDLSMVETMASHLGEAILERAAGGPIRTPAGNRHPRIAPHGIYATRDGWVAAAAPTERSWRALTAAIGRPELAAAERFSTADRRKQHEDELDEILGSWCCEQAAGAAADALRTIGCAAEPVVSLPDVLTHPHPTASRRHLIVPIEHREAGTHPVAGSPWLFDGKPVVIDRPAPCLGEHSFEVLSSELGLSRDTYDALVEAGITGDMPPD